MGNVRVAFFSPLQLWISRLRKQDRKMYGKLFRMGKSINMLFNLRAISSFLGMHRI